MFASFMESEATPVDTDCTASQSEQVRLLVPTWYTVGSFTHCHEPHEWVWGAAEAAFRISMARATAAPAFTIPALPVSPAWEFWALFTGDAVSLTAWNASSQLMEGFTTNIKASVPVTTGAAMDVPLIVP